MTILDDYEVKPETTLDELRAHRTATKATLTRLRSEVADLSSRTSTPGIEQRISGLETSIRSHEDFDTVLMRAEADRIRNDTSGRFRSESAVGATEIQHMRRVNPWDNGADLGDRAKAAVDQAHRSADVAFDAEKLERMIDSTESHVSDETRKYILATGSPAYRSAFAEWLRNPTRPMFTTEETQAMRAADSVRAALSLTTANGGALVPYMLDPTVNLTNSGTASPYRQVANVVTIAGANEWRGVKAPA